MLGTRTYSRTLRGWRGRGGPAASGSYPAILQLKVRQLPRYSCPLGAEAPPLTKIFGHYSSSEFDSIISP